MYGWMARRLAPMMAFIFLTLTIMTVEVYFIDDIGGSKESGKVKETAGGTTTDGLAEIVRQINGEDDKWELGDTLLYVTVGVFLFYMLQVNCILFKTKILIYNDFTKNANS